MLDIFQVYDMALLGYQGEGNEGGEGVGGLLSTLVDDKRPLNNRLLGRIVHPYDAFRLPFLSLCFSCIKFAICIILVNVCIM